MAGGAGAGGGDQGGLTAGALAHASRSATEADRADRSRDPTYPHVSHISPRPESPGGWPQLRRSEGAAERRSDSDVG
jgi:hypothetical protein